MSVSIGVQVGHTHFEEPHRCGAACVAGVPFPIPPYANFTDPYHLCLDDTGPPGHELRYARHDMHVPNPATHMPYELFDSKPRHSPATAAALRGRV